MTNGGGKDPFDFDEEDERTIIQRPNPGGRLTPDAPKEDVERTVILGGAAAKAGGAGPGAQGAPASALRAAAQRRPVQPGGPVETAGPNPLIAAGAKLIFLAGALKETPSHDDIPGIRRECARELEGYEAAARKAGVQETDIRLGHYVLCALIDDVVLSTPWGARGGWSAQSLTASFHNQVDAGDRLYELEQKLERTPGQHPDVLELIYCAMSLGFEGRMRIDPRGPAQITQVRDRLYRLIRERRGDAEKGLSPKWRGAGEGRVPLMRTIPLWVFAAGFGVLALAIYSAFLIGLNRKSDAALAVLAQAPVPAASASAYTPPPAVENDPFERVRAILQPDIDAGRVVLLNKPGAVLVRIVNLPGAELFGSGSATPSKAYAATIGRIGEAAKETGGGASVLGYSDSQPIRTLQFPSNAQLSQARADAIADAVRGVLGAGAKVDAQGLGPSDPIADNATPDGRRQNRRVEVMLRKDLNWN